VHVGFAQPACGDVGDHVLLLTLAAPLVVMDVCVPVLDDGNADTRADRDDPFGHQREPGLLLCVL
jgi:hypothetical protein